MKSEDLILLGGGVVAAFLIWRALRRPAAAATMATGSVYNTQRVTKYDGWEYYSDGTAIAPNGDYYYQGALIWRAAQ